MGEHSVVPDLVCLLADEGLDVRVRSGIALAVRELEERSVVPELARLLSDERLDRDVQTEITRTIGALAEDEVTATILANYLNTLDNADHIYHALWNVSCRARVRVFTRYGPDGEEVVEVIKETHQK
jgi:HEAT repeat protein